MDILIFILALMGLVLITWGSGAGILSLAGNSSYKDKDLADLPIKGSRRRGVVRIDVAYRNKKNGTLNAMVSSPWSGEQMWVSTDNENDFEKKLNSAIDKIEASSIAYRRMKGKG